ncbi:MAG: hypothetical protein CR994_02560 [Maribacter sp.]|nr:MAG: hypothetical protein CR994_02560 [Maribacter sp.]
MKHEWRKKEKSIYLPKNKPELVNIPEYRFITLSGEGNPNSDLFSEHISVLYNVAYAIKMNIKKVETPPKAYQDWTVYPLEGVWDISENARPNAEGRINKDDLVFDLMIRQPDFVSPDFFNGMIELTKRKKPHPLLDKVEFRKIKEGKCIQMLHTGSYDNEPESFKQMEAMVGDLSLKRKSKAHREIYLSDFRKVAEDKLKTVLRFQLDE